MSNNIKHPAINIDALIDALVMFSAYVRNKDKGEVSISFDDGRRYLGREENFKSEICVRARLDLACSEWRKDHIGTGKIAKCALQAVKQAGKLVNFHQKDVFRKCIEANTKEAESILYSLYCENRDEQSFKRATDFWGAKYDLIAYLFFIKDSTRYLPISSGHFDKGFKILGINFHTAYSCCWDNYLQFTSVIADIQQIMAEVLPFEEGVTPRLIDAHSFVWIISHEQFGNWIPGTEEQEDIAVQKQEKRQIVNGSRELREYTREYIVRNTAVAKNARARANGTCQLCGMKAPFIDKHNEPFLEVHHIEWLSQCGADSPENTIALCPNCHRKMHIIALPEDVETLKRKNNEWRK